MKNYFITFSALKTAQSKIGYKAEKFQNQPLIQRNLLLPNVLLWKSIKGGYCNISYANQKLRKTILSSKSFPLQYNFK